MALGQFFRPPIDRPDHFQGADVQVAVPVFGIRRLRIVVVIDERCGEPMLALRHRGLDFVERRFIMRGFDLHDGDLPTVQTQFRLGQFRARLLVPASNRSRYWPSRGNSNWPVTRPDEERLKTP